MTGHIQIDRVETLELPGLAPYRTLRRPEEHRAAGIFVGEGSKVVERLIRSPLNIRSLLVTPEWFARIEGSLTSRGEPVRVYIAEMSLVQEIVGFHLHQGIMAVASVPREPEPSALPSPHCLVALDGLHHADNVGVVVRNCAALGADAIIVGERGSSPYVRRAVRNSMGAVFTLPVFHSACLADSLKGLRGMFGTYILAADSRGGTPIEEARLSGNICIVAGNEESGVSPAILDEVNERVCIPMSRSIDSLNVASACAVFLHEARRRRTRRGC